MEADGPFLRGPVAAPWPCPPQRAASTPSWPAGGAAGSVAGTRAVAVSLASPTCAAGQCGRAPAPGWVSGGRLGPGRAVFPSPTAPGLGQHAALRPECRTGPLRVLGRWPRCRSPGRTLPSAHHPLLTPASCACARVCVRVRVRVRVCTLGSPTGSSESVRCETEEAGQGGQRRGAHGDLPCSSRTTSGRVASAGSRAGSTSSAAPSW